MVGLLSERLLNNPLLDIGIGLLSASGPSTQPVGIGQALASALQFAGGRQQDRLRNDLFRDRLLAQSREREAAGRVQGLLGSLNLPEQQRGLLGALAGADPGAAARLGIGLLQPPEPTGIEKKAAGAETLLGRPLTDAEKEKLIFPQGTRVDVNLGAEPLKVSDLTKLRFDADGDGVPESPVPFGATGAQAVQMGAVVVNPDEREAIEKANAALGVFRELEQLAFGEGGVFNEVDPGLASRVGSSIQNLTELVTQDNPNVARFQSLSEGSIATFVRLLGERGALAEGDVSRALGLIPEIFPLTDTTKVAKDKMKTLEGILLRGISNFTRSGQGAASQTTGAGAISAPQNLPTPPGRFRFNPATGQLEPVQ